MENLFKQCPQLCSRFPEFSTTIQTAMKPTESFRIIASCEGIVAFFFNKKDQIMVKVQQDFKKQCEVQEEKQNN